MKNQNWIEIDFNNWQNNEAYEKTFNDLKFAILNRNIISFSYFSSNQEKTCRTVKPARLLFKGQDWYLYAFCLLRNDFRYFKLSRVKNLEILLLHFKENFGDIRLRKDIKPDNMVRINGDITKDDEGNLYTEIDIPNSDTLYNYIFSFGNYVEVLEPEEVRFHIKNLVNEIADKYKT